MKKNYPKRIVDNLLPRRVLLLFALTCIISNISYSQTITYGFANAQITNDGMDDFYEADIVLTTDTDFALGAGQFYLDYNTAAFGSSIEGGNLTFTHPLGSETSYVLDERIFGNALNGYNIVNANSTASKLSISWSTAITGQVSTNITSAGSPVLICHIKIKYVDVNEDPNISFDTTTSPDAVTSFDLTFTDSGTQLTNDSYDSSESSPCIMWDGSTDNDWNTASNWGSNSVPTSTTDVMIPANQTVVASGSIDVKNLNIESGAALTVAANLNNSGTVTVNSGASLIAQSSTSFDLTYKRTIGTTNWYLVSSTVTNETLEDIISDHGFATGTGSNIGIGDYVNSTPGWTYATLASTGTLASGEGRAILLAATGDISFSGNMPLDNVSIMISDGGVSGNGFNLIGNPYPSYIPANHTSPSAANNILRANTAILEQETLWFWDQSENGYVAVNQASALIDGIRYIPPGQGFFVESTSSGGSFLFSESMQSHQSTDVFSRNSINNVPKIRLIINGNGAEKETNVLYLTGATTGWDNGYDSTIFSGADTSFIVYTHLVNDSQGEELEIQSLPDSDYENMVIPVGVNASSGTSIDISVNAENFPVGMNVYLEDRDENIFTNLSDPNTKYTLTPTSNLEGIGRFYLHTTSSVLSIDNNERLENVSIYMSEPNNLRITGVDSDKVSLELYSIEGKQLVKTQFTGTGINDIPLPKMSYGIYIVKLQSDQGRQTKKIIIE